MPIFIMTVGLTLGLVIAASVGLSWLNSQTVQAVVNRTGKANFQLWLMRPGIFVHETLHALVGLLFGVQVTQFSLRPDANSAAHVSFRYNRHSWWQRLGVALASAAPLWGIGSFLLLLGKHAWFPGVSWQKLGEVAPTPDWPWVLGWLVAAVLLTFGASLSRQDLRNTWVGLPLVIVLLIIVFFGLHFFAPVGLTSWVQFNVLLAKVIGVMAAIGILVNRLMAL
ncbi:hypothetical protein [Lacticaseibacillus sp. GG6-2]